MKKTFFLLCALLLVLGTLLPIAGYRLTLAVFGPAQGASSAPLPGTAASETAPDSAAVPPSDQDSESFLLADQSAGAVVSVPRREYLIGAVAAEMPISWPDEALKAQAIAAHSYALYCRDHAAEPASGWLSVDPVRRQGYLTDAVLRSYWGTAYEENYARLSALVDSVLTDVLYYGSAPAGTSYFAISNGMTEASEKSGAPPFPILWPWTAPPTSMRTTIFIPSNSPSNRCSRLSPGWACSLTLPHLPAGSERPRSPLRAM